MPNHHVDYRPALTVDHLPDFDPKDWTILKCDTDGNCFYHALSMSTHKNLPPIGIRMDIIRYIGKKKYTLPTIRDVVNRVFSGIQSEYFDECIDSNSWANHEEIQICAKLYNITICIWHDDMQMWTACFPSESTFLLSECRKVIYLYSTGAHFDLLLYKAQR